MPEAAAVATESTAAPPPEAPAAAAPPTEDRLAPARAIAARKIEEARRAKHLEGQTQNLSAELAKTRGAHDAAQKEISDLKAKLATLSEDPITRWMREGKTPDQVRAELAKLDDPVAKELVQLRKEREEEKLSKQREIDDQQARQQAQADEAAAAARETKFLAFAQSSEVAAKYPNLVDLNPQAIIATGYRVLHVYVNDCQQNGDRRSREAILSDLQGDDASDRLCKVINYWQDTHKAARKAKAAGASQAEAAPPAASPGPAPGKKIVTPAPRSLTNRTAPPVDFSTIDFDKLSPREADRMMAQMLKQSGAIKKKTPAK